MSLTTVGNFQETGLTLFRQGLFEISSDQKHRLGARRALEDGRVFVYTKAGGTDLAAGKLCVAATVVANHQNISVASAAAVGDKEVTVTLGATAATKDQYAEGYMVVNDADGEGHQYKIRSHAAAGQSASLTLYLYDGLKVALTTSSEVCLLKHPYDSVVVSATDQADMAVGVPPVAVTASYYFWLQTWGVCSALADETLAVGKALTIGTGVAGALEVLDAAGEAQIAIAIQAGVDTEYRQVFLTIQP